MLRWVRILVSINVVVMLVQASLAGGLLGGVSGALSLHEFTGKLLVCIGATQVLFLFYLRRKEKLPHWLLPSSIGILVAEVVEFSLGHLGHVAIHVPLGVAIFGAVVRQAVWALLQNTPSAFAE